jgi:NADPH-dependent 2,4-dienoyl-CoA reductase/sulfur reductase-like enzyme
MRKCVNIPVACVGRITDPIRAEEILEEGKADLITLGRALIADPEFPKKALQGRLKEIRYCIGCNNCVDRLFDRLDVNCAINARMGVEERLKMRPVSRPKRVLIIGGGPAGLEAARIAARRKHEVYLYEKSGSLGGQLTLASTPPGTSGIKRLIEYLVYQIEKEGVRTKLGVNISTKTIDKLKPEKIIIATGASPENVEIPGSKLGHVYTAHDVLAGKARLGKDVVIVGGGLVGMETADFLSDQGKTVTIIEMLEDVGLDAGFLVKKMLLERLNSSGVRIFVNTWVEAITRDSVIGSRSVGYHPGKRSFPADTVVLATGSKSNRDFLQKLDLKDVSHCLVGDCVEPRKIKDAIHEGFRAGFEA